MFRKYFNFSGPIDLTKKLLKTKDARKNSKFVEEIKNRWSNLKDKIKNISKEEIKDEKPDKILEIIIKIIDFNKEVQKQKKNKVQVKKF